MELSWEESLSQSRRLPLLQVVSNNKSFSVGVQSPTEINAPRGCAEEKHADVIVFEYLETKGKISGRKKQKLHLWRKRDIKKDVSTRCTGEGCAYPESVRGIPAGLPMMAQEQLSVIRASQSLYIPE